MSGITGQEPVRIQVSAGAMVLDDPSMGQAGRAYGS